MNNLYKNTNGIIYGIDAWQTVPAGMTKLTQKEYDAHVNPKPTPEQIQQAKDQESLAYLSSTDWYITRQAETGKAIPQDVLDARAEARLAVA